MIDFLLNNIVFVVIIVFGLFRLLASSNKASQQRQSDSANETAKPLTTTTQQKKEYKQPNTSEIFGDLKDLFKEISDGVEEKSVSEHSRKQVSHHKDRRHTKENRRREEARAKSSMSAAAAHEKQLEKLRKQYTTSYDESKYEDIAVEGVKRSKVAEGKYSSGIEDTDVKRLLNQRNLQESIVMAEILGAPRAYRPHQSSYRKRNI